MRPIGAMLVLLLLPFFLSGCLASNPLPDVPQEAAPSGRVQWNLTQDLDRLAIRLEIMPSQLASCKVEIKATGDSNQMPILLVFATYKRPYDENDAAFAGYIFLNNVVATNGATSTYPTTVQIFNETYKALGEKSNFPWILDLTKKFSPTADSVFVEIEAFNLRAREDHPSLALGVACDKPIAQRIEATQELYMVSSWMMNDGGTSFEVVVPIAGGEAQVASGATTTIHVKEGMMDSKWFATFLTPTVEYHRGALTIAGPVNGAWDLTPRSLYEIPYYELQGPNGTYDIKLDRVAVGVGAGQEVYGVIAGFKTYSDWAALDRALTAQS